MNNTDLYNLFELSPVPMWVFEVKSLRFLDVNVAATIEYGYTKEEFLLMDIMSIRPIEDVSEVKGIVEENSKTGSFFRNVFRHLTKNGKLLYVQIASNAINYKGVPARLVLAVNVTEKFEVQQALLVNERRFKALVQDGSDMITIIDKEFRYSYVSPASQRVFGVSPEFFIGKKAFDFIHKDDIARVEQEAVEIWNKKTIQLSPYRYKDAVGGWLWIETKATNLFDDPAVAGIVCTSKDITERIIADQRVAENVERFNIVSKATSDVIWDCDIKQGTILWNRAIDGILKHQSKERTSLDWWKEHIHPQDRDRVMVKLEEHISKGISRWMDEYKFLCGDGTYKNIFDRGFVMVNDAGKAYRMIGAMQDITDRKREEEWSKLLESVVVNTSDGVLITDTSSPSPIIIYVNQAMVEMSGYTREELIGKYPDVLHGSNTSQVELLKLKSAIETRTSTKVELINYTKNGEQYDVSVSLTPIFDEDGHLMRWISIQRDVSEQRRYVEQIEEKNRKLQDISWLQSHVVRTPLARIMSLVELLENTDASPQQLELLTYMRTSSDELDRIIREIANTN
ncbi:PAS domain-containing protein [Pedobacter boryungensis]|uniref:histidine kinase n=1 Tax=Pedobacter boryungensis TaxID=869962 RepID=A0ABX2D8M9_9SPHI|nr:PAS domain S-box protein [Pedobacter boryungensis]NQX30421.1 PAS domain S-box protein [Pedobacter boryungensis]